MLVPHRVASNAGSAVARTLGPLSNWHKRGLANLAHAYPDKSDAERRQVMDGVWDNIGRTMGEFARLSTVGELVTADGLEHIPKDGPVIIVSAHMANWEASSWISRLSGRELLNVYRRANNVYVDKLLNLRVHHMPLRLIEKSNRAGIHLLHELRAGGMVSLFVDQKGTKGDLVIPFMGKDALTVRTPAVLAAKTGATVVPIRMTRKNRHDLHITVYPPLPPLTESGPEADRTFMEQINNILTGWVKETPEQWLWIHRRWKNAEPSAQTIGSEGVATANPNQTSSV